jgi:proteic killer suppression protein
MDVAYRTTKLKKLASDAKKRAQQIGTIGAKRFEARISELKSAQCLEDLRHLPQARIHELTGDRKGQFSADLHHPYRLIFIPTNDPALRKKDGGWDWSGIRRGGGMRLAGSVWRRVFCWRWG